MAQRQIMFRHVFNLTALRFAGEANFAGTYLRHMMSETDRPGLRSFAACAASNLRF